MNFSQQTSSCSSIDGENEGMHLGAFGNTTEYLGVLGAERAKV